MVPDQDLGLALFVPREQSGEAFTDGLDHLIKLKSAAAHWYVAAVWDQLHSEDLNGAGTGAAHRNLNGTLMPADASPSRESFVEYVGAMSARMAKPAAVRILSEAAAAETAPPDTLTPAHRRVITARKRGYFEFIRRTLEQLATEGKLRNVNPTTAAFSLLGMILWISRWYRRDGKISPQEALNDYLEIAMSGVLKTGMRDHTVATEPRP